MLRALATAAAVTALSAGFAGAQTKWDMPTAYPATNFHTENAAQFAKDVDAATAGKVKIQIHANASLFKAPEAAPSPRRPTGSTHCWAASRWRPAT